GCRGVRQGCSLSGMLYTLAIEPFLNKLRDKLKGFSIPDCPNTIRLSAYADDIIVMVDGQSDIDTLHNVSNGPVGTKTRSQTLFTGSFRSLWYTGHAWTSGTLHYRSLSSRLVSPPSNTWWTSLALT
ncbi:hypothetical protein QTP70_022193, partial [Hemibagrus guttatus]